MPSAAADQRKLKDADYDSEYSDIDPNPNRMTRPKRRPRRQRNVCPPRVAEIAQPYNRTYQLLYHQHGWVLDPQRAARIRRKLEEINVMTLEQLEDKLAERAKLAKEEMRKRRKKSKQSFDEFSGAKLEELFESIAKMLTKKIMRQPLAKPMIVTAATKKLLNYAQDVVDNAMEMQRQANNNVGGGNAGGGVKDLVGGCPVMAREEKLMRARVAQEIAMLAKQVFFDTQTGVDMKL